MDFYAELTTILSDLGHDGISIRPETLLREELDVDSTDLVAIGMAVEKHMPFPVDTVPFPALETVGEIVALLQEARAAAVDHASS